MSSGVDAGLKNSQVGWLTLKYPLGCYRWRTNCHISLKCSISGELILSCSAPVSVSLSVAVIEYPDESALEEKVLILAYTPKGK